MAPVEAAPFEISRAGACAVVRVSYGKANAMDTTMLRALRDALQSVDASDARALVLTGRGAIFSAGVDLKKLLEGGRRYLETFLPELSGALRELFSFPRPVVAAVNGHAIAGGALMAWACDYRVMASGPGRIGVPELKVGVPYPLAALEILRFALPPHIAQEAALTGRAWDVTSALEDGMIDEIAEPGELMGRAVSVAEELGATVPASFRSAKLDLRRPILEAWARHGAAHEQSTLEAWASPEVQASVRAFVERTLRA